MNLTRRKLFRFLGIAPLAAAITQVLPEDPTPLWRQIHDGDNGSLIVAQWSETTYDGHTTLSSSLPAKEWRRLYANFKRRHKIDGKD